MWVTLRDQGSRVMKSFKPINLALPKQFLFSNVVYKTIHCFCVTCPEGSGLKVRNRNSDKHLMLNKKNCEILTYYVYVRAVMGYSKRVRKSQKFVPHLFRPTIFV